MIYFLILGRIYWQNNTSGAPLRSGRVHHDLDGSDMSISAGLLRLAKPNDLRELERRGGGADSGHFVVAGRVDEQMAGHQRAVIDQRAGVITGCPRWVGVGDRRPAGREIGGATQQQVAHAGADIRRDGSAGRL